MLELDVPNGRSLRLHHLVLDVNGTLALDGRLIEGVEARLQSLSQSLAVHLLTADTHGRQAEIDRQLGVTGIVLAHGPPEAPRKAEYVRRLGAEAVVAIGNGQNDVGMLREAGLSIAVVGPEGLAVEALTAAHVVVPSIAAALDLLLYPKRLVASLRG